ncbi:MAG: glycosyltransferase [Pseudanabaenaceae cyanobacterium SKYGB_i_bin29]|nr:glycosyltransferase [Pseudanabaenaceae cyanobacterium SKYG29]MDW8421807.1 glycosyltransferase [Pseudanabaenaceae cyanobacterium SKYGB_i_bin29]
MPPLVSICIPTFNGAPFIAATLHSAIHQTYRPLEIIISDDDSTDCTLTIAEEILSNSDIPYRIYRHDRFGLGHNWNYCIAQAQGKYIKFLLQDDQLHPDCVSELVSIFEHNPHRKLGMVFCRRQLLFSDDTRIDDIYADVASQWTKLETINYGYNLLQDPQLFNDPLNKIGEPTNTLILKTVFDRIGTFDPQFQQLIDLDMWWRIMGHYQIGFRDRVLAQFRIHRQQFSQTNSNSAVAWLDSWRLFFKMLSHADYEFLSPQIKKAVADKCNAQITEVSAELYQLRRDNQELNAKITQLGTNNEKLGERVQELGRELTEAHRKLTEAQTAFQALTQAEAKIQDLSQELEKVHHLYQTTVTQVQDLVQQLQDIDRNLRQTQAQLAESNSLVASQQAQITYLQGKVQQLQTDNAELQKINQELTNDRDEKVRQLQETLEKLREKNTALAQAENTIRAMESSKFWQLRMKWIALKRRIGLTTE